MKIENKELLRNDFVVELLSDGAVQESIRESAGEKFPLDVDAEIITELFARQLLKYAKTLDQQIRETENVKVSGKAAIHIEETWYDGDFIFIDKSGYAGNAHGQIQRILLKDKKIKGDIPIKIAWVSALIYEWLKGSCERSNIYKKLSCDKDFSYKTICDRLWHNISSPQENGTSEPSKKTKRQLKPWERDAEYYFGPIDKETRKNLLSGWPGISREIKTHIREGWSMRNTSGSKPDFIEPLPELVRIVNEQVNRYPLYLIMKENKPDEHRDTLVALLKHSFHCENLFEPDTAFCDPPLRSAFAYLANEVQSYCKDKDYTPYDLVLLLGYLADKCRKKRSSMYSVDISYYRDKFAESRSKGKHISGSGLLDPDLCLRILEDNIGHLSFIETDSNGFRFSLRIYRLLMESLYVAAKINQTTGNIDSLTKLFNEYVEKDEAESKIENWYLSPDNRFYVYCVFATGCAMHLAKPAQSQFIDELCRTAADFSKENRRLQVACIYTLSYMLFELNLSSRECLNILYATYGKTVYALELQMLPALLKYSFYSREIENSIKESLVINDGKVKRQPYFFLIKGALDHFMNPKAVGDLRTPDAFLLNAARIQYLTWSSNEIKEKDFSRLMKALKSDTAIGAMESYIDNITGGLKNADSKAVTYALSVSLLGFAVSNIIVNSIKVGEYHGSDVFSTEFGKKDFLGRVYENAELEKILHTLLLSDLTIRLSNPLYPSGLSDQSSIYLMCGAFRATRALTTRFKITARVKYEQRYAPYLDFLLAESRLRFTDDDTIEQLASPSNFTYRYAWLLGQLIRVIDLTKSPDYEKYKTVFDIIERNAEEGQFLPYDNFKEAQLRLPIVNL